jgi:hypothetical protein
MGRIEYCSNPRLDRCLGKMRLTRFISPIHLRPPPGVAAKAGTQWRSMGSSLCGCIWRACLARAQVPTSKFAIPCSVVGICSCRCHAGTNPSRRTASKRCYIFRSAVIICRRLFSNSCGVIGLRGTRLRPFINAASLAAVSAPRSASNADACPPAGKGGNLV